MVVASDSCSIQAKEIPWILGRKSGKHPIGCGSFHQQKTLPNVAYLTKKTVDSVAFWDPGFRGGGGIFAGKATHGKAYFIFPSPDHPCLRGNSGLGRVEVGCAGERISEEKVDAERHAWMERTRELESIIIEMQKGTEPKPLRPAERLRQVFGPSSPLAKGASPRTMKCVELKNHSAPSANT